MNDTAKRLLEQITVPQRTAIGYLERLCDGATCRLWKGNIIHGEQFLTLGTSIMMDDISTALLRLCAAKVIRPVAFRPSHSGAALLRLCVWNRRKQAEPNPSTAGHWDWEVTGEFAVLSLEEDVPNDEPMED